MKNIGTVAEKLYRNTLSKQFSNFCFPAKTSNLLVIIFSSWQSKNLNTLWFNSIPLMAYTGRLSPNGVHIRLQVYESLGISLVEVFERVGKSVIRSLERPTRDNKCILWL